MSPTDSVGSFSSGTESGLTKKCPRGPDSLRSAAAADDVVVTQDISLLAVRPLAGLVCEPIAVLLALRRPSISCRRRSRPARRLASRSCSSVSVACFAASRSARRTAAPARSTCTRAQKLGPAK